MEEVFLKLAEASPYAALLVLGFWLFFLMHKNALKEIRKYSESAIENIRKAYKDASRVA